MLNRIEKYYRPQVYKPSRYERKALEHERQYRRAFSWGLFWGAVVVALLWGEFR